MRLMQSRSDIRQDENYPTRGNGDKNNQNARRCPCAFWGCEIQDTLCSNITHIKLPPPRCAVAMIFRIFIKQTS